MNTTKIIKGVVNGGRYTVTAPIVKEDYGLYLQIEGVELPQTYEVDFSNSEHNGTSVTMIGNSDGVLIPHQFIDTGKDVFAFLYHVGANYGRTVYKFRIPNKVRPDRTNEEPTPEEQSVIDQAISALNEAVEQTAQDVTDADASAQSASADADRAEEARTDAQNYATQAEQSATDASASATSAEQSAEMISGYKQVTLSADVYGLSLNSDRKTKKAETISVDFSAWKGTERLNVTSITGIPTLYREGGAIPYNRYGNAEYGLYRFSYALSSGWEITSESTTATLTITAKDADENVYTFVKEWSLCIVQDGANGTDGLSIGIASPSAVIYADADGYTISAVTIKPVISAFKGSSAVSYSANSGDSITVRMRDGTVRLIRANISTRNYPPTWDIPKDAKLTPNSNSLAITVTADGQTVNLSYGYVVLADGADGDDYVLTEQDKQDIADLIPTPESPVQDVQIDGQSIVSDGVANVPIAKLNGAIGVVKLANKSGLGVGKDNIITVNGATLTQIKNAIVTSNPIQPHHQHESTFYGLAEAAGDTTQSASSNAVGSYTEDAKSKISEMLGGSVSVSGTTPTIVAKSGIRYVCGEVATLDFTPSQTGIYDVVFTSGATATVLTVPSTIKWANGFDPTSLDANTTYELNVMDGLGVAVGWT